jgi:excisionase family DNA binding protein
VPDSEFLTVAEVAEILKLNQQTVRNWIDAGKLPAIHVGRRVRIKRDDFNAIVDSGATGSAAAPSREPGPTAEDFWLGNLAMGEPVFDRSQGGT